MRVVLPVVLALVLGCSGLLPPSARVENPRAVCGVVEGEAVRESTSGDGMPLFVDDRPVQDLDFVGTSAPFRLRLPAGPHRLRAGAGEPVTVDVPASDLVLRWEPPSLVPLEGDPVALPVQVLGSCPRDGVELVGRVAATGAEIRRPLGAGVSVLELGTLAEGRHDVALTLVEGGEELGRLDVAVRVDPPCRSAACRDRDGDGHDSLASGGRDCDDTDPAIFPGATDFPDPDGDGAYAYRAVDLDCDGQLDTPPGGFDCAEGDASIPREEDPVPTGIDEDCDGIVDEGTTAYDDDGDGYSEEQGDCNDADPSVAPKRPELPDCKDNDCDGTVDDGVERPAVDDRYEPNDETAFVLAGAQPRRGPFGGYKPTEDRLDLLVRGVRDTETFSVYAHDGAGDSFHVTARLLSAGDGLRYRVRIEGPRGSEEEVLAAGGVLRHGGRPFDDDSGTYELRIEVEGETLDHCPLSVELTSG